MPSTEPDNAPEFRSVFFRRFKVAEEGPPLRLITTFDSRTKAISFAQKHALHNCVPTTMFDSDPPRDKRLVPIEQRFDSNGCLIGRAPHQCPA